MKNSTIIKLIGLFLIGLAILAGVISFVGLKVIKGQLDYDGMFINFNSENTIKTEGYITEIKQPEINGYEYYSLKIGDPNYTIAYSYTDENADEHIITTDLFSSSVKKGDKIDVYYDKNEPQKSMPSYASNQYNFYSKIFIIIIIAGFLPGIVTLIIGFVVGNKEKKKAIA